MISSLLMSKSTDRSLQKTDKKMKINKLLLSQHRNRSISWTKNRTRLRMKSNKTMSRSNHRSHRSKQSSQKVEKNQGTVSLNKTSAKTTWQTLMTSHLSACKTNKSANSSSSIHQVDYSNLEEPKCLPASTSGTSLFISQRRVQVPSSTSAPPVTPTVSSIPLQCTLMMHPKRNH